MSYKGGLRGAAKYSPLSHCVLYFDAATKDALYPFFSLLAVAEEGGESPSYSLPAVPGVEQCGMLQGVRLAGAHAGGQAVFESKVPLLAPATVESSSVAQTAVCGSGRLQNSLFQFRCQSPCQIGQLHLGTSGSKRDTTPHAADSRETCRRGASDAVH